jgi:anthranilate phosphoribosyltransferase
VTENRQPSGTEGEETEREKVAHQAFVALGGWPGVLGRISSMGDLSTEEAAGAMGQILSGTATPAQLAALAMGLRMKGETVEEISGLVRAFLEHAEPLSVEGDLMDTCGTGGDRSHSVNVSTIAALVVAGAGGRVCKHGNRAASSAAGSADVLEALGVVIDLGPDGVRRCIAEAGIGFCFAPRFHPAMRFAVPVRAELGIPTVFNFLGPLVNPAHARYQVVGVSDPRMLERIVGVLRANGSIRAMVVHGSDGLDELSTTGLSTVLELREDGHVHHQILDPAEFGLPPATLGDLRGGDAARNAEALRRVLAGEKGPHRDITVLNAAAGLVVAGLAADFPEGIERAAAVIDEGRAAAALERLVTVSQESSDSR